ncbi:MAG: ABC transporter substrate-binding protein [Alphaproteobacteria bacterium]|nr:ABC transporter substrate-binding protein [Alphaproteobacteria bacterium]
MSVCLTALVAALVALAVATPAAADGTDGPAHGMAMHGKPKYAAGFKHYDYVDPAATQGGTRVADATGTFDSLNQFIIPGTPAAGLGAIYDTLMEASADEAFTEYCVLCKTIEVPDDRSWAEFVLRADARWHDGKPITVDDVIWTFNMLRDKGQPFYRYYYHDVAAVKQTGDRKVRFEFTPGTNRELPLILGQLPVMPKHWWATRDFGKTTLDPPLGSGAYRIASVEPGRTIVYERVKDYWGKNLPTHIGRNNVDIVRYEYFRDRTVAREAFKSGALDIWVENSAKEWATAFDVPPVRDGRIAKVEFPHQRTAGMQGFAFNLRRPHFVDPRVRQALTLAFDFEWANLNLFYGAYTRTKSYFDNSELASGGLLKDAGAEEREILERFRGRLPEAVYAQAYAPPATGSGPQGLRDNLRTAQRLLAEAGWTVTSGKLFGKDGKPFNFEVLLADPGFERIVLPWARNLERLGIAATVRVVDPSQYQRRGDAYDFDVIVSSWGQSQSPGNEQREFWGSAAAAQPGARNLVGIADKAIDELIDLVIAAASRESLVARTRALDRALLWGHYVVPHWHIPHDRLAYWSRFGMPAAIPASGVQPDTWWIDPAKDAALGLRRSVTN